MPPRKSETLTEAELRLMDVLWLKGSATVQQVLDALPGKAGAGLQLRSYHHSGPGKQRLR